MSTKLKAEIRIPKESFGQEVYTVFVDLSNPTDTLIDGISVTPQIIPGRLLDDNNGPEIVELEEFELKKRRIVKEMESQISHAFEQKQFQEIPPIARYFYLIYNALHLFQPTISASTPLVRHYMKMGIFSPTLAIEALRIEDWEDIERLDNEIISYEKQNSFLQTAFSLNKEKLRGILDKIKTGKEGIGS